MRRYVVKVRVVETFSIGVEASTAAEAEEIVRRGDYLLDEGYSNRDKEWTSVKARPDDD